MKITLSYTICTASPWNPRYNKVGEFTLRERKTPEEIRSERQFLKSYGKSTKPNPYKCTQESTFQIEGDTCYFLLGSWKVVFFLAC